MLSWEAVAGRSETTNDNYMILIDIVLFIYNYIYL